MTSPCCSSPCTPDPRLAHRVLRFVAESPPPTSPATPASRPGSRYTLNRFSPQAVSEALCHRAKSVYEDQRAVSSPFALRAMEEGIHFAGGKRDDITTLIGVVGELEASPVSPTPRVRLGAATDQPRYAAGSPMTPRHSSGHLDVRTTVHSSLELLRSGTDFSSACLPVVIPTLVHIITITDCVGIKTSSMKSRRDADWTRSKVTCEDDTTILIQMPGWRGRAWKGDLGAARDSGGRVGHSAVRRKPFELKFCPGPRAVRSKWDREDATLLGLCTRGLRRGGVCSPSAKPFYMGSVAVSNYDPPTFSYPSMY